ncbi:MAG: hypothetical protein FWC40_03560 [Proteobacteria bacterium]|nr:hypothetical protein [Pseudomonadota bacterium]
MGNLPSQDAKTKRIRLALSREAILFIFFVLGLGSAAVYTGRNSLILLFCVLFIAIVVCLTLGRQNVKSLRLERRLISEFFANQESSVEVLVHNLRQQRRYGLHVYESFGQAHTIGPMFVPALMAAQTAVMRYVCVFPNRGETRFCQIEVRSRYPMPFFEFRATYACEALALVYPALIEERGTLAFRDAPAQAAHARRHHQTRLRELINGRKTGRIVWKVSAKSRRWIEEVRAFEPAGNARALHIKSPHAMSSAAFERHVSETATFALDCLESGESISLWLDETCLVPSGHGPEQRRAVLEALATV